MHRASYTETGGVATRSSSSAYIIADPNGIVKAIAVKQPSMPNVVIPGATRWEDKIGFFANKITTNDMTLDILAQYGFTVEQQMSNTNKVAFLNSDDFRGGKAKKNQSKKNRSKKNRSKKNRNSRRR